MSTTTMISLVGTAIASVATLVYAVYKKTEENRELREENIRMEERSHYVDDDDYVVHKSKKKKKKKRKREDVHWEYDPHIGEWVIVDGRFESDYEFDDPYDDDNVIPLNCRDEEYYQPPKRKYYPPAPREYAPTPYRQRYISVRIHITREDIQNIRLRMVMDMARIIPVMVGAMICRISEILTRIMFIPRVVIVQQHMHTVRYYK